MPPTDFLVIEREMTNTDRLEDTRVFAKRNKLCRKVLAIFY